MGYLRGRVQLCNLFFMGTLVWVECVIASRAVFLQYNFDDWEVLNC